jgi:PAS domain S-box-containing protein
MIAQSQESGLIEEIPLRVLVVDDNPQDRRLVIWELRKAFPQSQILEAINQVQLDNHLSALDFDVVVTDFHLQWSDGIRVLREVKMRTPRCPVIMFTATGSEEIAVEAMKHGLDDYVIKNVKHLVRLRGAVQSALEHTSTRIRAQELESRLQSLLLQLEVGVFSCSSGGSFIEINDAMIRLMGCKDENEAMQRTFESLFPDEISAVRFKSMLSGSKVPCETEIHVSTTEAPDRCYRLNATWVIQQGGESRIDGLLADVTIRKRAEAEGRRAAVAAAFIAALSPRERDVLAAVTAGAANKVIARRLEISEKTVEKHRSSLMKKLQVRSVAELVRLKLLADAAL